MNVTRFAIALSAVLLAACGGEKKTSTMDSASTAPTPKPAGASATASTSPDSAAPITGQTVEVKMLQDAQGNYRFEPADITIKPGDGVKFVMVTGGTAHNIAFDPAQIPPQARAQLSANMQQQVSELSSPMMMNPNETYTISFGRMPPGTYAYHCTPHLAMGMKGTITVQ
jgi:plastocyanin